ncbi:VAMP8 isoform 3 [Pan troglodytes]|uniref:Vesicle associated membrane protein 8 n=3 Tax=Homininae TaxID=207598 RepID=B8ZZT4_HUMAN|nr:vesicle-associated membrane protein 8 isoform X1 [Homo sapiens]XP_054200303.1 vesicle-associated membrane protein 8 isoform X1 [Homo sapiens]KAI2524132.1 vesicle associated membrane protein 8 [Homo sapiens]KAI4035282.1 vesicle associated membrane protein 8 [Homo sapiens]PNI42542.1 VAMP8 isoform 3 [Pan troglodytes]|eukprot:XP_016860659.1 vesicle-associated membrane protein 8 isoform X1 [Homo sapiens]
MEEASEGGGNDRVRNLQSEVEGVKNIMTQNVERILARGENLEHLRNKTEDLEATPGAEASCFREEVTPKLSKVWSLKFCVQRGGWLWLSESCVNSWLLV